MDTASRGAWLTQGYGFEPFVSAALLQQCLEKAQPLLARGQFAAAVAALLKELEAVLRTVAADLPRIFGLGLAPSAPTPSPASAW